MEDYTVLSFVDEIINTDNLKQQCENFLSSMLLQSVSVLKAYKRVSIHKFQEASLKKRMFDEIQQCSYLWAYNEHD